MAKLGGGNVDLGLHVSGCQARMAELEADIRDLKGRLAKISTAINKLEQSSFRDQAAPYHRAAALLDDQIRLRVELLDEWHGYRRDLGALAAAGEAETALDGLPDHLELTETITAERERLERLTGELSAVAEVEQLLRA